MKYKWVDTVIFTGKPSAEARKILSYLYEICY